VFEQAPGALARSVNRGRVGLLAGDEIGDRLARLGPKRRTGIIVDVNCHSKAYNLAYYPWRQKVPGALSPA